MEIRIKASDEGFEDIFAIATLIAAYKNPHIHFDLLEITEEERIRELEHLEQVMEQLSH